MAPQDDERSYRFAGYRLDPVRGMLLDPTGREVPLRPKTFALLCHLLDHPGRLLGREELFAAVWPNVVVTDDSLTQCISDLRRGFGSQAAAILRTVPRRGYMLTTEVQRTDDAPAAAAPPPPSGEAPAGVSSQGLAQQRRETLHILPVVSAPGDETAARLASQFASGLVTEMVRFEDLRIVARPEERMTQGFVLHTELHADNETFVAFVRLDDVATGTSFWADRIAWQGRSGEPPLATTMALAGAIDLQIERTSLRRAQQKPAEQLSARECCLIGRDLHQRGTEPETLAARAMFMRAAALDPGFAAPYAWAAFTFMRVVTFAWNVVAHGVATHGDATAESVRLARKAVELDPESVLCQSALGFALALDGLWDEAVDAARLALRLSRVADHGTRMACGEVLAAGGCPGEAVAALRESLALDPHCPPRVRAVLGRALLLGNEPDEALRELRRCAARLPDYAPCARTTVVAAVESGMIDEACAALRVVRRLRPQWVPGAQPIFWFLRRPEDIARFESAFMVAQRVDAVAAAGGLVRENTTRS